MILDATSGNRMMWKNNKYSSEIVYLDKQFELRIPPTIFADAKNLPFRSRVFHTVFFDPPHDHRGPSTRSKYADPKGPYYGQDITHPQLIQLLYKAPIEFRRVLKPTGRLCLKWSEERITLWRVMVFFKEYTEVFRKRLNLNARRRRETFSTAHVRGGGYDSFWVTFILKNRHKS